MTPTQANVLQAIRDLTVDDIPPSLQEIADHLGIASKSTVHRHLELLQQQRKIAWDRCQTRSLRIIDDPVSPRLLQSLSDEALRSTIALASRGGDHPTAVILRRMANALLTAPKGRAAA